MISITKLLRVCGIASLSALSLTTYLNLPSYAQSTTFFCAVNKGVPVTYARTPRGKIPMIRWVDNSFGGRWTPQQRCADVSQRFQRNYDNGTLKFITTGTLKGNRVVCAATSRRNHRRSFFDPSASDPTHGRGDEHRSLTLPGHPRTRRPSVRSMGRSGPKCAPGRHAPTAPAWTTPAPTTAAPPRPTD